MSNELGIVNWDIKKHFLYSEKYDILLAYVRRKEISEDETRKNIKYKKITEHSKKRRMR